MVRVRYLLQIWPHPRDLGERRKKAVWPYRPSEDSGAAILLAALSWFCLLSCLSTLFITFFSALFGSLSCRDEGGCLISLQQRHPQSTIIFFPSWLRLPLHHFNLFLWALVFNLFPNFISGPSSRRWKKKKGPQKDYTSWQCLMAWGSTWFREIPGLSFTMVTWVCLVKNI